MRKECRDRYDRKEGMLKVEKLLITNARIIDPSCQPTVDFVGDILIEGERIAKVGAQLKDSPIAQGAKLLDAGGL